MDYKHTLNLTLSDKDPGAMPQRGNLPAREPEFQKYWDSIDLYRRSVEKEAPLGAFILHDGPPYSNGDIHLGHALNKIAKDIIVKYKTMQGYRAPYVPGWDNHGMPIENEVSKEFRKKNEKPDKVAMRKRCREYAASYVEIQKEQFKRLGIRGDWDNPYLTMSTDFEAKIVEVFGQLAEKGYIYRGLKPVLWCAFCETALADAEVEYADHTSNSIYVRFPIISDPNQVVPAEGHTPYALIWTTTPWTIPANLALAVHPDAEYSWVRSGGDLYLIASALMESVTRAIGLASPIIVGTTKGSDLTGLIANHPIFARTSPIVFADYVTMEDGTGIVHTAPGHGKEDFETGVKYGLEILCPVDASGTFTAQAGEQFQGARILGGEADSRVLQALEESGHLLASAKFQHSYPHCWRCHNPLLFRATVQWFMDIDHKATTQRPNDPMTHRNLSLNAIQESTWYPPVSINRINSMVANRPDWCLSRQRAWGVGIPAFYCKSCGKELLSKEAIDSVVALVKREGSDAWYARPASEVLPAEFACPHCAGTEFDKETDILDVWFDSGSSSFAVLENKERWPLLRWPADVYLEGSDQHRGWFNSSLMVGVALRGRAPYNAVITNGWTLDETGKAMHKSLGNAVSPEEVTRQYGADILRLWVASTDFMEDVRCSDNILKQVAESYRRIRNTFRFLVNNLYDFDPTTDAVPESELLELDRWALARLDRMIRQCVDAYEAYEFHGVYHTLHNFCTVELSAFYLDVIKDRLYCESKESTERRSAQTTLHTVAESMSRMLAPILSFTAEEVWALLSQRNRTASVQLAEFPKVNPDGYREILEQWEIIGRVGNLSNIAVEDARQSGKVTNQQSALVEVFAEPSAFQQLACHRTYLAEVFKVSAVNLYSVPEAGHGQVIHEGTVPGESFILSSGRDVGPDLGIDIRVRPAPGTKCARCWLVKTDVGTNPSYPDICARCARVVAALPNSAEYEQ